MARLDAELVSRGIARSRSRAKEMIESGSVTVNGVVAKKASSEVNFLDVISSSENEEYVGRGALKLEKAFDVFHLSFIGKKCIDIGASTGGFTDFMLKNGASRIYAVDVGHGQLAESLISDSRVVNMEGTDIRNVAPEQFGGCADFISVDVSFISLEKVLTKVSELLKDEADAIILIKPQFEAGKKNVGKHGIVRSKKIHEEILRQIDVLCASAGLYAADYTYSPVKGGSGNIEYLVHLIKIEKNAEIRDFRQLVEEAFSNL